MVKELISKLIYGAEMREETVPNGNIIEFESTNARPVVEVDSAQEIELDFGDDYRPAPLEPKRVRSIANTFMIYVEEGKSKGEIWDALEKKNYSSQEIRAGYDIFKRSG